MVTRSDFVLATDAENTLDREVLPISTAKLAALLADDSSTETDQDRRNVRNRFVFNGVSPSPNETRPENRFSGVSFAGLDLPDRQAEETAQDSLVKRFEVQLDLGPKGFENESLVGRPVSVTSASKPKAAPRRTDKTRFINLAFLTVAVIAIGGVVALAVEQSSGPSAEASALQDFQAQQDIVAAQNIALADAFESFSEEKEDALALTVATAGAIAALAGHSDETARLNADADRLLFEQAVNLEAAVDPAGYEFDMPAVDESSSLAAISDGIDSLNAESMKLDPLLEDITDSTSAIKVARTTFVRAFTAFGQTIPDTANEILESNVAADAVWRETVAASVTELEAAFDQAQTGIPQLQAYAVAALALKNENIRVLAAQEQARQDALENEVRAPYVPPVEEQVSPEPVPEPEPTPEPAPEPEPTPEPEPEPDPTLPLG